MCDYEEETGHRFERIPERPVAEDVELLHLFELPRPQPTGAGEGAVRERGARWARRLSGESEEPAGNVPAGYLVPNGTCNRCNAPIAWVKTARGKNLPLDP